MKKITKLVFRQQSEQIKQLKERLETIVSNYDKLPSSVEKSVITRWAHGGIEKLKLAEKSKDNPQRSQYIKEAEALLQKIDKQMKK